MREFLVFLLFRNPAFQRIIGALVLIFILYRIFH